MKKEWICGCGITHHLEPSDTDGYSCRFGCGLNFGDAPPEAKTETVAEAAPKSEPPVVSAHDGVVIAA